MLRHPIPAAALTKHVCTQLVPPPTGGIAVDAIVCSAVEVTVVDSGRVVIVASTFEVEVGSKLLVGSGSDSDSIGSELLCVATRRARASAKVTIL
ncbi:hypothetical protein FRC08_000896 [Ceratobasidium sp. 394]|nr:hypothetical protein FRC08_000896 [Ceratobasidium sp. 394]